MDEVRAFSQRDGRWQGAQLGTGELTIGQAGCLLSAAAGMLASWGFDTDPGRLNEYVLKHYGFVDGNLFVFASIDGLNCRFVELIDCWSTAAPVDRLRAAVGAGAGVLACVDFTPGGTVQPHWVRVTALGEKTGQVIDPWQLPGRERVELATYLKAGWTPARGIFLAAVYTRVVSPTGDDLRAWRTDSDEWQPGVCVRTDEGDV